MGTGLPGVRHWGVKQLALREESGFFDGDLLDILILRHVAKSYNKGKKRCQEQPHKEVSHKYIPYLSDAEIRCYRIKISPGGQRLFCPPSSIILLSAGFDIPYLYRPHLITIGRINAQTPP